MTQAQADALHDRYRKSFVGRSRATRDLSALDTLIADTQALLAGGLTGALRASVEERLNLYRSERTEIAAAQAGGPAAQAGWRLSEWSEVNFARYVRHFSGQSRLTRDLGLLREMAKEEAAWIAAMPKLDNSRLDARRQNMEANLRLFEGELTAIPAARAAQSPAEQARLLATVANAQFALYRAHFEGKSRVTRRPALLERVIATLEEILAGMQRVRALGVNTTSNDGNITKVTERIAHNRTELGRIRQARAQERGGAIARALGDEANKLFAAYREEFSGKSRETRNLARLGELCDALQETARAMQALQDERPEPGNDRNIGTVLEHLRMWEREYVAIQDAQKKKA